MGRIFCRAPSMGASGVKHPSTYFMRKMQVLLFQQWRLCNNNEGCMIFCKYLLLKDLACAKRIRESYRVMDLWNVGNQVLCVSDILHLSSYAFGSSDNNCNICKIASKAGLMSSGVWSTLSQTNCDRDPAAWCCTPGRRTTSNAKLNRVTNHYRLGCEYLRDCVSTSMPFGWLG